MHIIKLKQVDLKTCRKPIFSFSISTKHYFILKNGESTLLEAFDITTFNDFWKHLNYKHMWTILNGK